MIRQLNAQQKRDIVEHNRQFLIEHPNYYKNQQTENGDNESDHSAEISAAKQGKITYRKMDY